MVEENHEDDDRTKANRKGELGLVLRVLSERRTDRTRLDDLDLHGQCAATQDDGEVLCLLERLLSRDLRTPAEDRLAYVRRGEHLSVKQDRNRTPDVLHRQVGEFLCALIRELEVDDVLPRLRIRRCLCILQIGTGQDGVAVLITELEHRRLADGLDCRIWILDARQLDDDAPLPLTLDDRFGEAKCIDALLHDRHHAVHRIVVDLRLLRIDRLQDDMRTALQVKPLSYGARKRPNTHEKSCDDDGDRNHQL